MSNAVLAGTGHRPNKLGGYSDQAKVRLVAVAFTALTHIRPRLVITGMALGWDTALAIAAYGLGIPYLAAVPFEDQDCQWPAQSRVIYREILANAERVVQVCEPGYAAWKMQRRNGWMVQNCDQVLAMWDGTDGGTANCVHTARGLGRHIFNYYPMWRDKNVAG